MALDDRDYMRRRAGRGEGDWTQAVYQPRAFRGRAADGALRSPARRRGSRAVWLGVVLVGVLAAAHHLAERRGAVTQYLQAAPGPSAAHPAPAPAPEPRPRPPQATVAPAPAPAPPPRAPPLSPPTGASVDPYTSVYLCRTWQGATFWSAEHCQVHRANLLRIHRVSSTLPWPQQVSIAQEEARQAARLLGP